MNTDTLSQASAPSQGSWSILSPLDEVRRQFNRMAFPVVQSLSGNPLFSLDALLKVAKEAATRPGDLYFDAGKVNIDDKWGHIPVPDRPVEDIIHRIETAGAWIVMKHVEQGPGYREVLEEFDRFVRHIAGPEHAQTLSSPEMLIFITSPRRITPFHFDAETNFLVQLQAEKDVWICDPADRVAVTDVEIERYYSVNINAGTYKPGVEARARHFLLKPGDAVHIPTHAAHWVHNRDGISISLSLNFELPASMHRDIYRANHMLRRMGINPSRPGERPLLDHVKVGAFAWGRRLKRLRPG